MSITPQQYAHIVMVHATFGAPNRGDIEDVFIQAMQQARNEALEEAAQAAWTITAGVGGELCELVDTEIRALKNKES